MTIEIRQLVIRAVVVPARESTPSAPGVRRPEPRAGGPEPLAKVESEGERESLVAACVRDVMRELRKSRER